MNMCLCVSICICVLYSVAGEGVFMYDLIHWFGVDAQVPKLEQGC